MSISFESSETADPQTERADLLAFLTAQRLQRPRDLPEWLAAREPLPSWA